MTTTAPRQDHAATLVLSGANRDADAQRLAQALESWIRAHVEGASGASLTSIDVPRSSGLANQTVMLEVDGVGGSSPRQAWVARIGAAQTLYLEADLETQYRVCRAVAEVDGVPAPAAFAFERDPGVLGAPFYLMERSAGTAPPESPPFHRAGWVADLSPAERRTLWRGAVEVLARLHAAPATSFSFLADTDAAHDGLARDLAYWGRYAAWALEGRAHPVVEAAARWLAEHRPAEAVTGFAWGDARVNNMLFRGTEVVAVLDWDTASLAGAESDLAWWAVMDQRQTRGQGIARLEGFGTPRETIALWEQCTGRPARHMEFHLVYAAYRLALIRLRLPRLFAQVDPSRVFDPTAEDNSVPIQYLRSLLGLPQASGDAQPWPGLD